VALNEVVRATLRTAAPLAYDPFAEVAATGSAILIDETGNGTVAAVLLQP
jgi:sulfate adenylyltransferase subunit 1